MLRHFDDLKRLLVGWMEYLNRESMTPHSALSRSHIQTLRFFRREMEVLVHRLRMVWYTVRADVNYQVRNNPPLS